VKDTESVKVAGTVLTRDTDYTVDYNGNTARACSAAISCRATIIDGYYQTAESTIARQGYTPCMRHPYVSGGKLYGIKASNPLTFDLGAAHPVNTLYLPSLSLCLSASYATGTINFEYSVDNVNWTSVVTIASTAYYAATATPGGPEFTFTEVTARYWRLKFTQTAGETSAGLVVPTAQKSFFGYVGTGIVFTTAPAADASILIKAQVDRPWKTADYVIDTSMTLTL
jgi:hypothetical protein